MSPPQHLFDQVHFTTHPLIAFTGCSADLISIITLFFKLSYLSLQFDQCIWFLYLTSQCSVCLPVNILKLILLFQMMGLK